MTRTTLTYQVALALGWLLSQESYVLIKRGLKPPRVTEISRVYGNNDVPRESGEIGRRAPLEGSTSVCGFKSHLSRVGGLASLKTSVKLVRLALSDGEPVHLRNHNGM